MRQNMHKLSWVLAHCSLLCVFLVVSFFIHTPYVQSAVYDVVSPGSLQPGRPVSPPKEPVVLTVRGRTGMAAEGMDVMFDMATLEQVGLIRFTTPTAWTDGPVTFEGVLVSRILELLAVSQDVTTLALTALNDYRVEIPVMDVRAWPVIIALKRDGKYMSVREKGPLWVVYPRHAFPELAQPKYNSKWIWQLKEMVIH